MNFRTCLSLLLLLLSSIFSFSQNTHILKPNGELIRRDKFAKDNLGKTILKKGVNSKDQIAFTPDTLSYTDYGEFNTDFGFNSSDVMLQYFQAPADLIVKAIGFSCSDDSGATVAGVRMKLFRLNWLFNDLKNVSGPKNIGVYLSEEDGDGGTDPFGWEATSNWIDYSGGEYPLPPWTNNISPVDNTFEFDFWEDSGFGFPITPEKQESPGNYQWFETSNWGESQYFEVAQGEVFAVVLFHDGYNLTEDRIGFYASSGTAAPGWKYYEKGKDNPQDGWWVREFTWDFAVAVDIPSRPRVSITNITELRTTTSLESRTVQATISTDNPTGGQSGIQSAELLYSLDSGKTYESVPMEYIGELIYSADIPGQPPGTYVIYKIKATEINGYSYESVVYTYKIFEVYNTDLLILFNGGTEGRANQLTTYYLNPFSHAYYDLWGGFGPVETDMLSEYGRIFEIHAEGGPADDNREAIRSFVEAGGKELIVIGQEALGYLVGFQDSIFQPGDYEYDILGVKQSFNDINYDTSSQTGQYGPSLVRAVENTLFGDSLALWISENNIDSLFYDPTEILGSDNWMDQFIPRDDINSEVFMTGFSHDGVERPIAHHFSHPNFSEVTFFSFDPLALNTDSVWIGDLTINPLAQLVMYLFIRPLVEKIDSEIPDEIRLYQNYPNPFNPATQIRYSIPVAVPSSAEGPLVTLKIFDILGKEVETLVDRKQTPGNYEVEFDGSGLSSGIYFYKLFVAEQILTNKMLLLK